MIGAFPTIRFQSGLDRPADSGVAAAAGFFHDNFVLSVCLVRLSCRFVLPSCLAGPHCCTCVIAIVSIGGI